MTRLFTLVALALTMTAWSTVVAGHDWYLRTLALITTAAAAAAVTQRFVRPRGTDHLVALVLGVAGLTWMFAPGIGPIPTPSSLQDLSDAVQEGSRLTNTRAAPLPEQTPVVALVVGVLFLLWWAADLIAVGAGLPVLAAVALLVVYGVPASVLPHPVPLRYFIAGAAGLLLLLLGGRGSRLSQWGHVIGRPGGRAGYPVAVAAVVVAFVAALVLPARLPGTQGGWVYESRHADSGTSTALSTDLDLHADLVRPTDRSLIQYTSTTDDPDPLRMFVVDSLDGNHWTAEPFEAGYPNPSYATGTRGQTGRETSRGMRLDPTRYTTRDQSVRVSVKALHQDYLPNPGDPLRLLTPTGGEWGYDPDLDTLKGSVTTRSTRYTIRYRQYIPRQRVMSRPGLRAIPSTGPVRERLRSELALPSNVPSPVRDTARRVAGPATVSDYVRAQRLQAYFRSGDFTYTTQVSGNTSPSAMADFLRDRRGYCVHFATTMTLMARSLGIPARVVVGLAPGGHDATGWTAREHDAHAWPELFFNGIGWVRFEPTPNQSSPGWSEQADASTPSDTSGSSASSSSSTSSSSTTDPSSTTSEAPTSTDTATDASTATSQSVRPSRILVPMGAAATLVAVAAGPALAAAALRRRRRRGPDAAEAGWAELGERVTDLGVDVDPARTPRDLGTTIAAAAGSDPAAAEAIRRRVGAVEQSRYSTGDGPTGDVFGDVDLITRAVAARAGRRRRLAARWWPRAVFRRGRH